MRKLGIAGLMVASWVCASCSDPKGHKSDPSDVPAALPPEGVELSPADVAATPEPSRRSEVQDPTSLTLPGSPMATMPGTPPDMSTSKPAMRPAGSSPFGGPCASTQECESGLSCQGNPANPALFEAVPGGYCSVPCQQDTDCARLPGGKYCDRLGFCNAPCDADRDPASAEAKCGGRLDELTCFGSQGSGGICASSCTNDEVCGPGRECYYGSGTCVLIGRSPALLDEAPIGAVCKTDAFTCRGYCLTNGADTASLCSGVCAVGASGCGGDVANLCVPLFTAGRHGDRGTCYQTCRASTDCAQGQGECVPSGIASPSGERMAYCQPLRAATPTTVSQRLSVEDLGRVALPGVEFVASHAAGQVNSRLSVEDGQVCISGDIPEGADADTSLAHLAFHFGLLDPPTPRDVSAASTLNITMTSDRGMYLFATLVGRPDTEYGTFVLSPPQNQSFQFTAADLQGAQVGALPWDPTLLDTVEFRLATGAGPFRLCVSHVAFE